MLLVSKSTDSILPLASRFILPKCSVAWTDMQFNSSDYRTLSDKQNYFLESCGMTEIYIVKPFSKILQELMDDRKVTQTVLSQATGVPKTTINEWLKSDRTPKLDKNILNVARFFGIPVEYFIEGKLPEQKIIEGVLHDLDTGFVSIHQGVYRINVEKLTNPKTKKED